MSHSCDRVAHAELLAVLTMLLCTDDLSDNIFALDAPPPAAVVINGKTVAPDHIGAISNALCARLPECHSTAAPQIDAIRCYTHCPLQRSSRPTLAWLTSSTRSMVQGHQHKSWVARRPTLETFWVGRPH